MKKKKKKQVHLDCVTIFLCIMLSFMTQSSVNLINVHVLKKLEQIKVQEKIICSTTIKYSHREKRTDREPQLLMSSQ